MVWNSWLIRSTVEFIANSLRLNNYLFAMSLDLIDFNNIFCCCKFTKNNTILVCDITKLSTQRIWSVCWCINDICIGHFLYIRLPQHYARYIRKSRRARDVLCGHRKYGKNCAGYRHIIKAYLNCRLCANYGVRTWCSPNDVASHRSVGVGCRFT